MNNVSRFKYAIENMRDREGYSVDVFCYTETRKEAQKLAETYRKQRRLDTLKIRKLDAIDRGELFQKIGE